MTENKKDNGKRDVRVMVYLTQSEYDRIEEASNSWADELSVPRSMAGYLRHCGLKRARE